MNLLDGEVCLVKLQNTAGHLFASHDELEPRGGGGGGGGCLSSL